jgi:hypothetical protein
MTCVESFVSVLQGTMRFLPLIWSGLWRKPGRTILIFLQVAVAFALLVDATRTCERADSVVHGKCNNGDALIGELPSRCLR